MTSKEYFNLPIKIPKPLFNAARIKQRIVSLAREIADDFRDTEPVVVGLLKGSFMFLSDLIRQIHQQDIPLCVDFMGVSSYGDGMESSGNVRLFLDVTMDIEGRAVLLIDDIIDTGRTLQFAHHHLMTKKPELLKTCVLLDKPSRRAVSIQPDYVGFTVPDAFVVGYGLDYQGRFRELPFISTLSD